MARRRPTADELTRLAQAEEDIRKLKEATFGAGGSGGGTDVDTFGLANFGARGPLESATASLSFAAGFVGVRFQTEVVDIGGYYDPAFAGGGIWTPPAGTYYVHASFQLFLWTAGYIDVGFEVVAPGSTGPSGLWPSVDAKRRWRQSFNATTFDDGMAVGHAMVLQTDGTVGIRPQMNSLSAGSTGGHLDDGTFQGWQVA